MEQKELLEGALLLFIFGISLCYSFGPFMENSISHNVPTGPYLASDAYQDLRLSQEVYNNGNYNHVTVNNELPNIIGEYSPGLFMLPAMIAYVSGINITDAVALTITLVWISIFFATYLLLRTFNKSIAVCSLPFMAFALNHPFIDAYTWGQWALTIGVLLVFSCTWILKRIELKNFEYYLGFAYGALSLAHQSELVWFTAIMGAYIIITLYTERSNKDNIKKFGKKYAISILMMLLFFVYYIPILMQGWDIGVGTKYIDLAKPMLTDGFPVRDIFSFGLTLIFVFAGLVIYLTLKSKKDLALLTFAMLTIFTVINYLGGAFAFRSLMLRFFWPFILSFFFGLGLYTLLKAIHANKFHWIIAMILFVIVILSGSNLVHTGVNKSFGIDTMNVFTWIKDNTSYTSRLLFFPSAVFAPDHTSLQDFRSNYFLNRNVYSDAVVNNKSLTNLSTAVNYIIKMSYWKGFYQLGSYVNENKITISNLCEVDYIVIDKYPQSSQIRDYNEQFIQMWLNEGKATVALDSNIVVILKINENIKCKKNIN